MRRSEVIALGAALLFAGSAALAEAPRRVVSMNLCTDQLAMLVAAPGQLLSVSHLAADPRGSAMAEAAAAYPTNHGLAEEIYLMRPDLVIAGTFSSRATVDMLRRLDIPVAVFDPAYGLDEVRDRLAQMGDVLGREETALALAADYDARLAALRVELAARPRAALYYANGYTSGDRTLAGQILIAAGFENAAVEAGFASGGILPLEVLAMLEPDALITGRRYPAASRSEEILDHPVVETLREHRARATIADRDWVCGTPYVLRAIADLAGTRTVMGEE
ncbi:ABC transporter substrate-binding protein [Roseobacter sp. HKCCA0434]|uniref:ABC transporter substrate-binding protein n=1 Tax=Roseobacter sp. HKCCA0434 TaxID=3079297 RepID=UPI0029057FED|nr:ABC transporter substrate-binding protein [Roseobacter sp. HKCCA0434]